MRFTSMKISSFMNCKYSNEEFYDQHFLSCQMEFFYYLFTLFKIMLLIDRIINKEMRCKDVRKYKTLRNIYNKKQNTLNYVLFLIIIFSMNMRHSMCKDERNFHISKTKFASCEEF